MEYSLFVFQFAKLFFNCFASLRARLDFKREKMNKRKLVSFHSRVGNEPYGNSSIPLTDHHRFHNRPIVFRFTSPPPSKVSKLQSTDINLKIDIVFH